MWAMAVSSRCQPSLASAQLSAMQLLCIAPCSGPAVALYAARQVSLAGQSDRPVLKGMLYALDLLFSRRSG